MRIWPQPSTFQACSLLDTILSYGGRSLLNHFSTNGMLICGGDILKDYGDCLGCNLLPFSGRKAVSAALIV